MSKLIGLTELQQAVQGKLEPVHETRTVTGSNGSITITDAPNAPLLAFTATGMGTPSAVVIPDVIGAAMGQQDWDNPMILDVPLGVVRDMGDFSLSILSQPAFYAYGGGVGSNSYDAASGSETGTTVYFNSRDLEKLLEEADAAETGDVVDEGEVDGHYFHRFEIPLPFSVAENSVVYCSHFKNQNISGEEGIWASGSTLYIRSAVEHLDYDSNFSRLSEQMGKLSGKINYYAPWSIKGHATENLCDFFVCLTAATSYTMERDPVAVKTFNGTYTYDWFKISDYLQLFFGDGEELPTLTSLTSISATYYTDIAVNRNLVTTLNAVIIDKLNTATVGDGAFASTGGGAVGAGACTTGSGGAVGNGAYTDYGGAVGADSYTDYGGGAVGANARAIFGGGAVGQEATANGGGAVGDGAMTTDGCAIGSYAICEDGNHDPIDAVQLGKGTNSTVKSMQVYGTQLLYYHSTDDTHYIPLSLITASYSKADPLDQAAFKAALGIS